MSYSELYRVLPLSSCAFNVCGSYAHFRFFIPHTNFIEQKYESAPLVLQVTTICMMTIHWFQVLIPLAQEHSVPSISTPMQQCNMSLLYAVTVLQCFFQGL